MLLSVLLLMPLVRMQQRAFADGAAGFRTAFGASDFPDVLRTTLVLAVATTTISVFLGTGLAFVAERLSRRTRSLAMLPMLPLVLPSIATVIGWSFLLNPRTGYVNTLLRRLPWWDGSTGPIDVYSLPLIVLVTAAGFTSLVYTFVSTGLRGIASPLLEAARVAGSSQVMVTLRISLPLLRPVLIYSAAIVFLLALGQVTAPLLLGRQYGVDVLSTEIINYNIRSPRDVAAAAAMGSPLLIAGLAIIVLQRWVIGDNTRFVTHGGKGFNDQRQSAWWAPIVIIGYAVVVLLMPLLAIVDRAFTPFSTGTIRLGEYSTSNIRATIEDPRFTEAIRTSLFVSLAAVVLTLVVSFFAAYALVHSRGRIRLHRSLDTLVAIPMMVPSTVIGIGFLLAYAGAPFDLYGSRLVIVLVYVALMIPFGTRMLMAGLMSLGTQYTEASRVAGAGQLRTTRVITIPLLRPAIGGAAALMFVLLSHEFSASVLVRSPRTQVMGTILFDFYETGSYGWVATMALAMSLITATGLIVAISIGGKRVLEQI